MKDSKPWYQSKVIIANVLGALIEMLTLDQLGAIIPAEYRPHIAFAVAALNIMLRFMTTQPVRPGGGGVE